MIKNMLLLFSFVLLLTNCSKDKSDEQPTLNDINIKNHQANGFNYKIFYQELNAPNTRRGLIILAVGDNGTKDDPTLNSQCDALAKKGFVAITTTYRTGAADYDAWYLSFKQDMEQIITKEIDIYNIPRDKVVLGGISRGGNLLLGSVIVPTQNMTPIEGIKGVILACAGGDEWKGSAIKYPVLFMSNETDNSVGTNANGFKNGLQKNNNVDVKNKSKTLIISGNGHCTHSGQYKDFIVNNIESWF